MIKKVTSTRTSDEVRTFEIVDLSDMPFAPPVKNETVYLIPREGHYQVLRHENPQGSTL